MVIMLTYLNEDGIISVNHEISRNDYFRVIEFYKIVSLMDNNSSNKRGNLEVVICTQ